MTTNNSKNEDLKMEEVMPVEEELIEESVTAEEADVETQNNDVENDTNENETENTDENDDEMDEETKLNPALMKVFELEKSIKTFYNGLQLKRNEIKKIKEMIKDALETDMTYATFTEKINEIKQEQRKVQDQIMQTSSIISAKVDMKDLNDEVKELQKLLSKFLLEYTKVSESKSITMTDGETYEILENARLIKQK